MADMRQIAASVMFFGALLAGILFYSTAIFDAHDTNVDDENLQKLSDDINQRSQAAEGSLQQDTREIDNGLEAGLFYLRGAFDAVLTLFNLFLVIPSIGATIMASLTLPGWVGLIISIPFVYVLITLIKEARRS